MKRRIAGLAFGALSLLFVAAAPASASPEPGGVSATRSYPGCFGERYDIVFGEAIAVRCGAGAGGDYGYRVVAHCSAGSAYWYSLGTFVPHGFGPSVAECQGGLLSPAFVGGYHVIDD
ncbi:hypothetical protein [Amycolatopsis sp. CA-230715]|uniref:hypothetical protein n=1 Tax=Amycolatopsis sp. CA-230715 TaxID=2745196 RepID=UPI001C01AFD6|nr:hypothetical protein [Amycolatopsis sp. CA-230715]QWF83256.1 hypothetical protein HUW46_06696 [Amycolatopsis sp. CA-230715]